MLDNNSVVLYELDFVSFNSRELLESYSLNVKSIIMF